MDDNANVVMQLSVFISGKRFIRKWNERTCTVWFKKKMVVM